MIVLEIIWRICEVLLMCVSIVALFTAMVMGINAVWGFLCGKR
jgi:hypothetical protein